MRSASQTSTVALRSPSVVSGTNSKASGGEYRYRPNGPGGTGQLSVSAWYGLPVAISRSAAS